MNLKPNFPNQSVYSRIDLFCLQASRAYEAMLTLLFYRNAIALGQWADCRIGLGLGMRSKCDFNRSLGGLSASFASFSVFQGRNGLEQAQNPVWRCHSLLGTC